MPEKFWNFLNKLLEKKFKDFTDVWQIYQVQLSLLCKWNETFVNYIS